jgi:hypothetical protein
VGNPLSLFVAVGGTGPFTYQWHRGATPVGTNSPVFELPAVQPTDAGSYTVQITNSVGQITSAPAILTVQPALAITTSQLPRATVGRSYAALLEAAGGTSTRTWTLNAGILPTGFTLTPDGQITGIPTAPARATLTFRVADASGFALRPLELEVRPIGGFNTDPDLILHYTFDEGTGTRVWDAAPTGNNHATDLTTSTWVPNGRFGGAYGPADTTANLSPFFPANQGDLNFNPRAHPFTISLWVRSTSLEGYNTLISKNGFADENWSVQYRIWTVNPATSLQGVSGDGWSGSLATASPTAINDGQWHLITLVNYLDGATWRSRLYYNGGSTFTQWNTGAGNPVSQLLRVGDTSNGWNTWNGQLDDLRIYRRALTPAEITALYNPAPVIAYDTWAAALPANQRALTADPDGDLIVNLLEYALGGDPQSAASAPAPTLSATPSQLSFSYRRAAPDIVYVVETSTTLAPGSWTTLGVTQDTTTPVGQLATATIPHDPATPRRFLRLRVSER